MFYIDQNISSMKYPIQDITYIYQAYQTGKLQETMQMYTKETLEYFTHEWRCTPA